MMEKRGVRDYDFSEMDGDNSIREKRAKFLKLSLDGINKVNEKYKCNFSYDGFYHVYLLDDSASMQNIMPGIDMSIMNYAKAKVDELFDEILHDDKFTAVFWLKFSRYIEHYQEGLRVEHPVVKRFIQDDRHKRDLLNNPLERPDSEGQYDTLSDKIFPWWNCCGSGTALWASAYETCKIIYELSKQDNSQNIVFNLTILTDGDDNLAKECLRCSCDLCRSRSEFECVYVGGAGEGKAFVEAYIKDHGLNVKIFIIQLGGQSCDAGKGRYVNKFDENSYRRIFEFSANHGGALVQIANAKMDSEAWTLFKNRQRAIINSVRKEKEILDNKKRLGNNSIPNTKEIVFTYICITTVILVAAWFPSILASVNMKIQIGFVWFIFIITAAVATTASLNYSGQKITVDSSAASEILELRKVNAELAEKLKSKQQEKEEWGSILNQKIHSSNSEIEFLQAKLKSLEEQPIFAISDMDISPRYVPSVESLNKEVESLQIKLNEAQKVNAALEEKEKKGATINQIFDSLDESLHAKLRNLEEQPVIATSDMDTSPRYVPSVDLVDKYIEDLKQANNTIVGYQEQLKQAAALERDLEEQLASAQEEIRQFKPMPFSLPLELKSRVTYIWQQDTDEEIFWPGTVKEVDESTNSYEVELDECHTSVRFDPSSTSSGRFRSFKLNDKVPDRKVFQHKLKNVYPHAIPLPDQEKFTFVFTNKSKTEDVYLYLVGTSKQWNGQEHIGDMFVEKGGKLKIEMRPGIEFLIYRSSGSVWYGKNRGIEFGPSTSRVVLYQANRIVSEAGKEMQVNYP